MTEAAEAEEVVQEREEVREEESSGSTVMFIVIGLTGGIIILFIMVWICICECRRIKNQKVKYEDKNKIEVIENNFEPGADDDDSE